MAVIYLKHPVHGAKVAIGEEEALADEKKGWTRYDVGALLTPKNVDNSLTPAPVSAAPREAPVWESKQEEVPQRRTRRRKEQTV